MPHDRMLATRNTYTWMHKYIFPGGFLPSTEAIEDVTRAHTDAARGRPALASGSTTRETLRLWDERFVANAGAVGAAGVRRDLPPDVALLPGVLPRPASRSGYLDVAADRAAWKAAR